MRIDCLQYANGSEKVFRQMREDDIGLVEICHALGARFMPLTYNTSPCSPPAATSGRTAASPACAGEALAPLTRARPASLVIERLEAFASRTYAPATEESRLRGAGGTRSEDG